MSTNCTIAIKLENNEYMSVYCHWDGYDEAGGVGPTLRKHWNSTELAQSLVALGSLSYIHGAEVCAYHRDKNEAWDTNKPQRHWDIDFLRRVARDSGAYLYIWNGTEWITDRQ
jgi:hypothetical protein